jgi:hypothetical protein
MTAPFAPRKKRPSDNLPGRVAKHFLGASVPTRNRPLQALAGDRIFGRIHKGRQQQSGGWSKGAWRGFGMHVRLACRTWRIFSRHQVPSSNCKPGRMKVVFLQRLPNSSILRLFNAGIARTAVMNTICPNPSQPVDGPKQTQTQVDASVDQQGLVSQALEGDAAQM